MRRKRIGRWKRVIGYAGVAFTGLALLGGVMLARAIDRLGPLDLGRAEDISVTVADRRGRLLRAYTTSGGRWRIPLRVGDVDPRYVAMLLAYEDKRFYDHPGVDPLAILRAGYQLVRNGRIISGASTLTMQVARLLMGRHERTAAGKFRQMVRAIQLERRFSKPEILGLYLTLAPFGGNLEGVRAATLAYFGKEPARLSVAEAALLVALPQSPEARRPDRRHEIARRARDRVLARVQASGAITQAEVDEARTAPVPARRRPFPMLAAHVADGEVGRYPGARNHRLTIDRDLQARLERLVNRHAHGLGRRMSAALIVVENQSGRVRAHVGSPGYLEKARFGSIDMVRAVRSPGSTLKPFIYGLAFEAGLAHPDTLIEDRPVRFGRYAPKNFDKDYRGTVTIRKALQLSLNVPAVKVLQAVGPVRLIARLRKAGVEPSLPGRGAPTIAIGLGGLGLSLGDLAKLYGGLARNGTAPELKYRQTPSDAPLRQQTPRRFLSPVAAWYVGDILSGTPAPKNAHGGRIAYKTGTSYGYRDAWAVGFDGKFTVAAWIGRPDGAPTPGLTGLTAAAPLLFDAFEQVSRRRAPLAPTPKDALIAQGRALPPPLRHFRLTDPVLASGPYVDRPVRIAFPPDRAELALATASASQRRPIVLKASGGRTPLTWLIDGRPISSPAHRREATWQPDGAGFATLSVIDANGRSDRVRVRLTK